MIRSRLSAEEVVATARFIDPFHVSVSDPRLRCVDSTLLAATVNGDPLAHIVEWPDRSLGVAFLGDEGAQYAEDLLAAYEQARAVLELLALDGFFLYDVAMPH